MKLNLFHKITAGIALLGGLSACEPVDRAEQSVFSPEYLGIETQLLQGDLVGFQVAMKGARDNQDVVDYAACAAAQYTLIRGYGFARHVRTNVGIEAGVWRGDAVYTISSALPRGSATIDAEVIVAHCVETRIPTV